MDKVEICTLRKLDTLLTFHTIPTVRGDDLLCRLDCLEYFCHLEGYFGLFLLPHVSNVIDQIYEGFETAHEQANGALRRP